MERKEIESALVSALDADGCMMPGYGYSRNEIASIAIRRWQSFSRRNKAKHPTESQRTLDLAKGLQEHFDPIGHDHPTDFVRYAKILAAILKQDETHEPTGGTDES
jgi:hypothetical protein